MFDTLAASRSLKRAGFNEEQSDALVQLLVQHQVEVATKEFVQALYEKLDAKIDRVHGELDAKIDRVHGELDAKIDRVHGELDAKIDRVHGDLDAKIERVHMELDAKIEAVANKLGLDLTLRMIVIVGLAVTLAKFL